MSITGKTQLICLIGSPVSHSISPAMHNEAFRELNLDYAYLCFDIKESEMADAVKALRLLNVRGFNCTMPAKVPMCALSDELSPAASMIGAVNTVVNDHGRLIGHNTDGIGYMMSAKDAGCDLVGKRMVQLGAGGAGTAILVQAAFDGVAAIDVFNTRDAFWPRVKHIVEQLNEQTSCKVTLHDLVDLESLRSCIAQADLLLNTTPVGMNRVPGCLIPDSSYFHPNLTVSDVIYEPQETALLKMAREAGLKTFNGMYMLLYQGAASFKLWTGLEMPLRRLKKSILFIIYECLN